jgi:adenylate cyclase
LGAVLYRAADGRELGKFGEQPSLSFTSVTQQQVRQQWFHFEQRYEAVWLPDKLGQNYILILRQDALSIQQQFYAYIVNIMGIVLLIAAVITLVTTVVVQVLVIVPILKLRDGLISAAEALQQQHIDPQTHLMVVNRQDELGDVITAFNQSFLRNYEEISRRKQAETEAQIERDKAEQLLLNILPGPIAEQLKQGRRSICDGFAEVSVLFADIVGFTALSTQISPAKLVQLLNQVFSIFDDLSDRYGLEKIKTIGDNYMVAGGLPLPRPDHAEAIAEMALEMQHVITQTDFQLEGIQPLSLRIGINTGSVIAGVIGSKKFIYDLWGDAVNTASRMESHSLPGCIQVTEATYHRLKHKYIFEKRGSLLIKGKGEMVTYWLKGRKEPSHQETFPKVTKSI